MRILMIILSGLVWLIPAHAASSENFVIESLGQGIYVHHGAHLDIDDGYQGDICNISFVVGSKGVAVIDTGGSLKVGQQLRQAIAKVTSLPVLYVINTHVHPDHTYGNAAFLAIQLNEVEPEFIGHEKLSTTMELRQEQYAKLNANLLGEDALGTILVKPSIAVKSSLTLDLGDRSLVLTAHPVAHTHTDLTVMDSQTQTLFSGDLLFIERTPVVEGDVKGLIAELDKLKLSGALQVVPGHGPVSQDGVLDMNKAQTYLQVLLNDIRASIKQGVSMEATMNTAAATEKDKWLLFDVANRRNVNTLYPALEWE
jgi:quinoprotein relay system zinc metallohydrolase 2